MSSKKYFQQLRQSFKNDPYQDRFVQELQDHAQDLEAELPTSKKLNLSDMKKEFGDPKTVRETFNAILRPWEKLFFVFEGLFYGILMLPFSLMGVQFFHGMVLDGGYFNINIIILAIIWFFVYLLAFRRYLRFQVNFRFALLAWIALVFGPTLLYALSYFIDAGNLSLSLYSETAMDYLNPKRLTLVLTSFLSTHIGLSFLAWSLQKPKRNHRKSHSEAPWMTRLKTFLFVYFVLFLMTRTLSTYLANFEFISSYWQILNVPFSPLIFIEFILNFIFSATFGNQGQASVFFGFYVPAMILGFLTLQSIVYLIYQKTWRSRRTLIVLYAFSLLLINPQAFALKPDYQVPWLSVSEIVEKRQVGPFYAAMQYFNRDEGLLFHYQIDLAPVKTPSSLKFEITQNTNRDPSYIIDVDGFESADYQALIDSKGQLIKNLIDPLSDHRKHCLQGKLPEEECYLRLEEFKICHESSKELGLGSLTCDPLHPDDRKAFETYMNEKEEGQHESIDEGSIGHELICEKWKDDVVIYPGQEPDFPTERIPLKKDDNYQYTCQKLFVGDEPIAASRLMIEDWLFSDDGHWLMLLLSTGTYNPQEVHLLDLRNLNNENH